MPKCRLNTYDDPVYGVSIGSEPRDHPMLQDSINWSTIDIDKPYVKGTVSVYSG